ncbi:PD-(D/E)XK nuclease family protein [Oceanisphaera sp.]|uniref:PDDEXK-like family protein n=1 Tax=Oceanisphaera sp. TaxID=1929979 RepID=UPI003A8F1D56
MNSAAPKFQEEYSATERHPSGERMNLEALEKMLAKIKSLPHFVETEPTLFSLGGRGYFENPTTDILAFFLDPAAHHKLGDLALSALLDCLRHDLHEPVLDNTSLCTPPEREVSTATGSRIDLFLESDDWIMVLENKIYHHQNNPFESYRRFANERAGTSNKQPLLVVLSPDGSAPVGWHGIGYPQLIELLSSKLSQAFISQPLNKWHILLREFLLHLESLMNTPKVADKTEAFVLDNLNKIQQALELKNSVVKSLQQDCRKYLTQQFDGKEVGTQLNHWHGYPALRFGFGNWQTDSDVVLFLDARAGNQFAVNYYACQLTTPALRQAAIKLLSNEGCTEYWDESRGTVIGFKAPLSAVDRDSLFRAVRDKLALMDVFEAYRSTL